MNPSASTAAPRLESGPAAEPGLLGRGVLKLLAQRTQVAAVRRLTPQFCQVSLRSQAFRTQTWVPGDKLQVRVAGMSFRTFTPFRLGGDDDVLELLGHVQGSGPMAHWLAQVASGQACDVRGPRRSMDVGAIHRSTVFFGDETSLGLAVALCSSELGGLDTHFIFEVGDADDARHTLAVMGKEALRRARFIARAPGDAHLGEVEALFARHAGADRYRHYVLSGRSSSLQRLGRSLRVAGVASSQMLVKAYWAPGKTGLD